MKNGALMAENRLEHRVFEAFHAVFESELPEHRFNHRETFEAASSIFQQRANFVVFTSYESFKNSKSRFLKRRRKNR